MEKSSIPENETSQTKKQKERLKEINSELDKISVLREKQEVAVKKAKQDKGKIEMPKITTDILNKDDSVLVKDFWKKYAQYGFTFEIDEFEGDYITARAWNGQQKKFKVDANHVDPEELDRWMRENATWYPSVSDALVAMPLQRLFENKNHLDRNQDLA